MYFYVFIINVFLFINNAFLVVKNHFNHNPPSSVDASCECSNVCLYSYIVFIMVFINFILLLVVAFLV